jgi:glycosyltransferase involved in cell wall biosynthesis
MKVLLVTTSYPDDPGSTRGIFIQRLARELEGLGVEVVVLTPRVFSHSPLHEAEPGIEVHRFRYPSGNTPLNRLGRIPVLPMCVYLVSGFIQAVRLILQERPDVIHGNWIVPAGLIASLAGLVTRTPVVNSARGMDVRVSESGPVRLLFDLAVRLSARVTVVSEDMLTRPCLERAEVITSGAEAAFFEVSARRDSNAVLHVRALEAVYDPLTLVRAIPAVAARVPDARFTVAGTGSLEGRLKALSAELGVAGRVDFTGVVPNREVASLMASSSVYVSASTADGTSIALLEAIAAGLVPVVTDIGPNRLYVTHGVDGYLFRPGDAGDLGDKLTQALTRGIPREVLEKKSSDFREKVSWRSVANRFVTGYKEVVSSFGRG